MKSYFLFIEHPVKEHFSTGLYFSLILVTLIITFLFAYYKEQSKKILSAAFNMREKNALNRADSEIIKKVSVYMNIFFFINILLFAYAVNHRYKIFNDLSGFQLFLGALCILFIFLLKYGIHYYLAVVFKTKEFAHLYLEDSYLKYKLYGVFLFPLILLILFSNRFAEAATIIGIVGFLIIWILKSYYGLKLGLISKIFPKQYSFLYICTLEILPLVLLCKIFWEPMNSLLGI